MSGSNRKALIIQFIKFNMVGLLNTAIDFAVFFLLIWLSTHYAVAQAVAYLAGMVNSYIWNKAFTFKASTAGVGWTGGAPEAPVKVAGVPETRGKVEGAEVTGKVEGAEVPGKVVRGVKSRGEAMKLGLRFITWNGIMLGLSVLLLAIATHTLGLDNLIGKVIVTIVIVFLNFYGSKRWVFVG